MSDRNDDIGSLLRRVAALEKVAADAAFARDRVISILQGTIDELTALSKASMAVVQKQLPEDAVRAAAPPSVESVRKLNHAKLRDGLMAMKHGTLLSFHELADAAGIDSDRLCRYWFELMMLKPDELARLKTMVDKAAVAAHTNPSTSSISTDDFPLSDDATIRVGVHDLRANGLSLREIARQADLEPRKLSRYLKWEEDLPSEAWERLFKLVLEKSMSLAMARSKSSSPNS